MEYMFNENYKTIYYISFFFFWKIEGAKPEVARMKENFCCNYQILSWIIKFQKKK